MSDEKMKMLFPSATVETVDLREIIVEDRIRTDMGDIDELAKSHQEAGPIQLPLCNRVDGKLYLVAGGRRYAAYTSLAEKENRWHVQVMVQENMDPQAMAMVELFENLYRKELTWAEQVRGRAKIHKIMMDMKGATTVGGKTVRNSGHSLAATAKMLGITPRALLDDVKLGRQLESLPEEANVQLAQQFSSRRAYENAKRDLTTKVARKKEVKKIEAAAKKVDTTAKAMTDAYIVIPWDQEKADIEQGFFEFLRTNKTKFRVIECDPPYEIDILKSKKGVEELKSGYRNVTVNFYQQWLSAALGAFYQHAEDNAVLIFWGTFSTIATLPPIAKRTGWKMRAVVGHWVKSGAGGSTENPEFSMATMIEHFAVLTKGTVSMRKPGRPQGFQFAMVPSAEKRHLTQRPLALMTEIMETFVVPGSPVFVPCAGSGVTIEAAVLNQCPVVGIDVESINRDKFVLHVAKTYQE